MIRDFLFYLHLLFAPQHIIPDIFKQIMLGDGDSLGNSSYCNSQRATTWSWSGDGKKKREKRKKMQKMDKKCSFHSVLSASFFSSSLCSYWLAAAEYIKSVCKLYANSLNNRAALVKALSFLSLSLHCYASESRCDPNSYHRNYCVKFEVCKDEWHRIILCRWIWFSGRILHFNLHTHSLCRASEYGYGVCCWWCWIFD